MPPLSHILGAAILLCACTTRAQPPVEVPAANPGRPTVSTPATLTPVGYLQFENGVLYASDSPEVSSQTSISQVTKLTVDSRLQVLVLSQPLAYSKTASGTDSRLGGGAAGVQAVVIDGKGHRPTLAVSYLRRTYNSGAPDLDIASFSQSALVLLSCDAAGFHIDTNAIVSEQTERPVRRAQFGQTLSLSHPIGNFTVAGELWHFTQPLSKGNAVGGLWAVSYPVRKNLVVDAGFDHGFTSSSTQWEGFAGFTYLLPHRLWRERD
jgi:hypothetical protein